MKKMHKRVLALLMALVLMFSCTAFASATEATSTVLDTAPIASPAGSEDGIMPLDSKDLTGVISVDGNSNVYEGWFHLDSSSYVVLTSNTTTFYLLRLYSVRNYGDKETAVGSSLKYGDTIPAGMLQRSLGQYSSGWYFYRFNTGSAKGAFALNATNNNPNL